MGLYNLLLLSKELGYSPRPANSACHQAICAVVALAQARDSRRGVKGPATCVLRAPAGSSPLQTIGEPEWTLPSAFDHAQKFKDSLPSFMNSPSKTRVGQTMPFLKPVPKQKALRAHKCRRASGKCCRTAQHAYVVQLQVRSCKLMAKKTATYSETLMKTQANMEVLVGCPTLMVAPVAPQGAWPRKS